MIHFIFTTLTMESYSQNEANQAESSMSNRTNHILQSLFESAKVKLEPPKQSTVYLDMFDSKINDNGNDKEHETDIFAKLMQMVTQQQQQQQQQKQQQKQQQQQQQNQPQPQPKPKTKSDQTQPMINTDILDDLATRFILNMPIEEQDNTIRICFQIENAYWFYLDFYCAEMKQLPKMKLKRFAQIMFEHIPNLQPMLPSFQTIMDSWIAYKFSVPCCGAILLDKSMRYVLLVQGMSKNWSFPKGKKNQEESLTNCAIREVFEETGYDCSNKISEDNFVECEIFESRCRLFVINDVELDFDFSPHVRGEIQKAEWFDINQLANQTNRRSSNPSVMSRFNTVIPFINDIRKWIDRERKRKVRQDRKQQKRLLKRNRKASNETDATSSSGEYDGVANNNMTMNSSISNSTYPLNGNNRLNGSFDYNIRIFTDLSALEHLEPKTIEEIERDMILDRCNYDKTSNDDSQLNERTNTFNMSNLFNLLQQQKSETSFLDSVWSTDDVTVGETSDYQNSIFEETEIINGSSSNSFKNLNKIYTDNSTPKKQSINMLSFNNNIAKIFNNQSPLKQDEISQAINNNSKKQFVKNVDNFLDELSNQLDDSKHVGTKTNNNSLQSEKFTSTPKQPDVQNQLDECSQTKFQSAYELYMASINRKKEQLKPKLDSNEKVFNNSPTAQLPFYYSFNSNAESSKSPSPKLLSTNATVDNPTTLISTPEKVNEKIEDKIRNIINGSSLRENSLKRDSVTGSFSNDLEHTPVSVEKVENSISQPLIKKTLNGNKNASMKEITIQNLFNSDLSHVTNGVKGTPQKQAKMQKKADDVADQSYRYNGLDINNVSKVEIKIQHLLQYLNNI